MRRVRATQGFTIIEVVVVLAIVAVLAALAAPRLVAFGRRQDAREMVQRVANLVSNARSEAIRTGNNQFLLFDFPSTGTVRWVDDANNDWQVTSGETTRDVVVLRGLSDDVSRWGAVASPPSASPVPEDGGSMPSSGTTFPVDGATSAAAVGFTSRGMPVSIPAGAIGSGEGSYYVTDNNEVVYAATLLPLGGTRMRIYRPEMDDWY